MTDEEKIKLASQIAINFGIDFMDAKCRVEQAFMNFGKEFNMSTETSDKNVAKAKILIEEFNTYNDLDGIQDLKQYIIAIQNLLSEREQDKKRIQELEEERQIVGMPVRNKRSGKIGVILHKWESGSIAVLEKISPRVINTHENMSTLEVITDKVIQEQTIDNVEGGDKNVASEEIMTKEAFDELIDNLEVVEKLTLYGRKAIKYHVKKMQQQIDEKDKKIQELEEENRIFALEGSRVVLKLHIEKNYIPRQKVKEKIEELRPYIYKGKNAPQDFLQYRVKAKISVLEELLEEGE